MDIGTLTDLPLLYGFFDYINYIVIAAVFVIAQSIRTHGDRR